MSSTILQAERTPIDLSTMSAEEARVAIAKDALALLNVDFLLPACTFLYIPSHGSFAGMEEYFDKYNKDKQVDDILRSSSSCKICALGALFVSTVLHNDKITFAELFANDEIRPNLVGYMEPFFSLEQMDLIESAFEGWHAKNEFDGRDYMMELDRNSKPLLQNILENIIRNNGTFITDV